MHESISKQAPACIQALDLMRRPDYAPRMGDKTVNENVRALRTHLGLDQTQFGARIGSDQPNVSRWEKGVMPGTRFLAKMAQLAGVTPEQFIEERWRPRVAPPEASQQPARRADAGETAPLLRLDLSLPMGPGAAVDDYVEEEPVETDIGYMRLFTRTPVHRLRLARGVGDSMFPTLQPNDEVLIDTTQNQLLHSDRVYAASINGGATIKRLRPIEGGRRVLVIPDNKVIPAYEVDASEVRIWGMVIRFARDL